jgi:hypothetical protein
MDFAGRDAGSVREPTARYFIGLVTKYEPILCLATVEPSNISSQGIQYVLPNPMYGTTGTSRNYLKEGLVFTNIIPPVGLFPILSVEPIMSNGIMMMQFADSLRTFPGGPGMTPARSFAALHLSENVCKLQVI